MEQNIRNQVFETNSSTTHSLTILSEDEFNEFEKGDYISIGMMNL